MINAVSITGGHLGAGLGVVELTVALHYVFDTPRDRLIWDVGHQAYPHKILTGRRDRIRTLRQGGGLSGFHQARRERIRSLRRRPLVHLDLGGARHGGRARLRRRSAQRRRGHRRRVHVRGHGLRGHEQRRRDGLAADRGAQRQRHVDRPAGRRAFGLPVAAALGQDLPGPARKRQADRPQDAARDLRTRPPGGRTDQRLLHRRNVVRATRLLLRRPDRRAQFRPPAADPREREGVRTRSDPGACRHAQGEGLRPGRSGPRQAARGQRLRRRERDPVQTQDERPGLHQGVRRQPGPRGAQGRSDRRGHGRHAGRHRARQLRQRVPRRASSTSASPSSTP